MRIYDFRMRLNHYSVVWLWECTCACDFGVLNGSIATFRHTNWDRLPHLDINMGWVSTYYHIGLGTTFWYANNLDLGSMRWTMTWCNYDIWEMWNCSLFVNVDYIAYVINTHVIILLHLFMLFHLVGWPRDPIRILWLCTDTALAPIFIEYRASSGGYWQTSLRKSMIISNSRMIQLFWAALSYLSVYVHISDLDFLLIY